MSVIVTADLHLTDNPRDDARWGIFQFLAERAEEYGASTILILGDLTDAKDKHPAKLVNDMVTGFEVLAMEGRSVFILRGNHDYIEESEPFFEFANSLDRVRFITEPRRCVLGALGNVLLLPNSREPEEAWEALDFRIPDFIFCHQTFQGAITESGFALPGGIDPAIFGKTKAKIYSGDIHKPQIVCKRPYIEYVGAPYLCRFGDDYIPRVLLIRDDGTTKDLHFPTKGKHVVKLFNIGLKEAFAMGKKWGLDKVQPGDQIKVRVELPRAHYPDWPKIKAAIVADAQALDLELFGPELIALQEKPAKGTPEPKSGAPGAFAPEQALRAYAKKKGASGPLLAAGEKWLKEARGNV